MKSESCIIIELGAVLFLLSLLSFFHIPAYEKGAWFAIGVFASGFSLVLGYKFGKGMPEQASQMKTTSEITTQAPPNDPGTKV